MDQNYIEYNQEANTDTDPSSCVNEIELGCTNSDYLEYDVSANTSDETLCLTLAISGCTDSNYLEYDETANVPDSSK